MKFYIAERIEQVHQVQGPEIIALLLQDMCLLHGFSSEAATLLVQEKVQDSLNILKVLIGKNIDDT